MTDRNKHYRVAYLMHGARNLGGGERSIYNLIVGIRKDLFTPIVFYAHENAVIQKFRGQEISLVKIPFSEKITSVYRDEIKKNPVALCRYAVHMIISVLRTFVLLKRHKIDLLHPHDNLSKIIGGLAAIMAGVKTVTHCRDLLKENAVEKMLIYYQLIFMDRIIAVSNGNRDVFRIGKRIFSKVKTIYNGIDTASFSDISKDTVSAREELNLGMQDFVIGVVGVFDKCKGHIYLFQAIEKLVREGYKNIVCLVIGDGREKEVLHSFVNGKGLQDNFKFLGYRNDIPELMITMDVVVMPSVQESFPRVPLEAMSMGLPVIATRVGGMPESIEDGKTGILVPSRDVDSLSKALKYLIENPEIRGRMGEEGRKRVEERFSLKNNIRNTESVYLDVLEGCADGRGDS